MMDMRINKGTFKITDDNKTIVSSDVAEEINNNYKSPDDSKDNNNSRPDLTIKD